MAAPRSSTELAPPWEHASQVPSMGLELLAGLNHEIRTPLSGILGMMDLLLETRLDDEQKDYVGAARECAETLFELLNAALEYTSLNSGCVQLEAAEFRCLELLDGVLNEVRTRVQGTEIDLQCSLGATLDRVFVGDAYRVRQVAAHLLLYSVRHCAGGVIEFSARIQAGAGSPVLSMSLMDDGEPPGGAGRLSAISLSLAVLRRLVKLLSGTIDIDTPRPGRRGLKVDIPLAWAPGHDPGDEHKGAHAGVSTPRILVVDDNRISQQVIGALLGKGGWQFDAAADGPQAIAAARKGSYQLILMDLQMPGMDGVEACRHIREIPGYETIPILALTADVSDQVRTRCKQNGMDAFLEKPIHAAHLQAALTHFLSSPHGD